MPKTKSIALRVLLAETKKIVATVGEYAKTEFRRFQKSKIEFKSNARDLVSFVDKETEKKLITRLLRLTPGANIIGEENTHTIKPKSHDSTGYTWIIDPIDGTTNFVHGIPLFCISVGLLQGKKLVLGVVYNPVSGEMFYATHKTPAMLNGKRITSSSNTQLDKSVISIGISLAGESTTAQKNQLWLNGNIGILFKKCRAVRGIGTAALSLCWVAAGRVDAYFERGLNAWDAAGGALIVQQASGKVTDFENGNNFLFGGELLAAGKVHAQFLKIVNTFKQ